MTITASVPTYRFVRSPDLVSVPTPASTMINPGDLIWLNSGVAAVASAFAWDTNLATTQPEFRVKFLGVAVDQKLASDASTQSILVMTRGVFSYPCAALSGAKDIGTPFGPAKDPAGSNLLDQVVAPVATFNLGIGTLAEEAANGATTVKLNIQSWLVFTSQAVAT